MSDGVRERWRLKSNRKVELMKSKKINMFNLTSNATTSSHSYFILLKTVPDVSVPLSKRLIDYIM